jgi:AraC-like DNA-binding protein
LPDVIVFTGRGKNAQLSLKGNLMLVLDTSVLSTSDRGDAYQSSVSQNCTTSTASFESPKTLWAKVHAYDLGPAKVLTIDASGTTLRRTPRMARAMNDCPIALAMPLRTVNRLTWEREDQSFDRRDLMLVDLSAPYTYGWQGDGASYAFHVDYEHLDLPMDVIHTAALNLRTSPIYALVRDHITRVMTDAQQISDSGTAPDVGAASAELMRALIVSAADDSRRLQDAMHSALIERVLAYVRHHLRDHDLTPAKIAAGNAISVRELYRIYERRGLSLEQSITQQRLLGAHDDLTASRGRDIAIATIASRWGFSNPSFFASRFKREFGMSPRQWRELEEAKSGAVATGTGAQRGAL